MRRILALLSVLAVVATACGSTADVAASSGDTTAPVEEVVIEELVEQDVAEEAADEAVVGADDPAGDDADVTEEVSAESVALRTGREAILANHSDGKPYVLWYWGAHWSSCRQESAAVAWATRQNTGVEIIGVPNPDDGDDDDRQEFMDGMSTQVSQVLDNPDEFWRAHQITGNPAAVFVSADGTTETHLGAMGPQDLLERLEALAASA